MALYWQRRIRKGRSENENQFVVLDDPSFFAGEMDGFVSLEVMEDYDLKELTGIGAGGPAWKKKMKERSLQKVNFLEEFKTYRTVRFRR